MTREAYRDKALSKFSVGMVEAWQSLEHDSWTGSLFWMRIISATQCTATFFATCKKLCSMKPSSFVRI
jgi:hypothetical protein